MCGPIYEPLHITVNRPHPKNAYEVDIRKLLHTHLEVVHALKTNYNVNTAVMTYNTSLDIYNWTKHRVDHIHLLFKTHTTQVTTRIYALLHFSTISSSDYYLITRIDIVYKHKVIDILKVHHFANNKVTGLHTFLGGYINDVMFIIPFSRVQAFNFCSTQSRRYGATAGKLPLDSHELNFCMETTTLFKKQYITTRARNDMYRILGHTKTPLFIYYVTDLLTSCF